MSKKDDLPTIDPTLLATVAGGTTSTDQFQAMMQQILTSIQDLAQNQNGGGDNMLMQMLPIMMIMRERGAGGAAPPPPMYPDTVVGPDGLTYTKQG